MRQSEFLLQRGTTRDIYILPEHKGELVKKVHRYSIGYTKSLNEYNLYQTIPLSYRKYLNPILKVEEHYSITRQMQPLSTSEMPISSSQYRTYLTPHFKTFIQDLKVEYKIATDLRLNQLALSPKGHLVLLDYGETYQVKHCIADQQQLGNIEQKSLKFCPECKEETIHYMRANTLLTLCKRCGKVSTLGSPLDLILLEAG